MKRSLLVGVKKYPSSPLLGCVNDALDLEAVLSARGFDSHLLIDDEATYANITAALRQLVAGSSAGDELVFYFSGHGWLAPFGWTSEGFPTRVDQAICPIDYDSSPVFNDDEFRRCLRGIADGARLTVFIDACYSGTLLKDAVGETKGRAKRLDTPKAFEPQGAPRNLFGVKQTPNFLQVDPTMKHLLLAAARSDETASDSSFNGRPNGAFTYVFLQGLRLFPGTTNLQQIEGAVRRLQELGYAQVPQLEGPQELVNAYPFGGL